MFNLETDRPPQTSLDLTLAIADSLKKWIRLPAGKSPVHCTGELPSLASLSIDLSSGIITTTDSLPFENTTGEKIDGPRIGNLYIQGKPISVTDIPLQLQLSATEARFAYQHSQGGNLVATLESAARGELAIQIDQADLNSAVLRIARKYAGDSITITSIDVALSSISPTAVKILLTIAAKKFVTAIIKVAGQLNIDDQLVATATGLTATSEGMVGNIAVGMLQPQLKKIEGKPLPLMAFSLGNVKLKGVKLNTTGGLHISATFGSSV